MAKRNVHSGFTYHVIERADAEKHDDEHDDACSSVAQVRPPHASWYGERSVLDLCRLNQ